jgi:hypothetical protein
MAFNVLRNKQEAVKELGMTATAIGVVVAVMLLISVTSPIPEDIPEDLREDTRTR